MSQPEDVTYRWRLLRAGEFRLDGGSMFGLIPRAVWSRAAVPDEKGRVTVQHNCLLLEGGGKRILIETGSGDKLDEKSRSIFAMQETNIVAALAGAECAPESIDAVVTTHLHFDHSGGLTRLCRPGETPDWFGPAGGMAAARPDHGVKLTFPNAKVFLQLREWDDALHQRSVMTRTYFEDHLLPIKGHAVFVDSPRPFPGGYTPGKRELPKLSIEMRETPLPGFPNISVFLVPGHTWGQQAVKFNDAQGRAVVFVPDCLPTAWHSGQAYSLGYDVEPYTSSVTRHWLLHEAAARDWLLVLDHEPGQPCHRVRPDGKGWFTLVPDAP